MRLLRGTGAESSPPAERSRIGRDGSWLRDRLGSWARPAPAPDAGFDGALSYSSRVCIRCETAMACTLDRSNRRIWTCGGCGRTRR